MQFILYLLSCINIPLNHFLQSFYTIKIYFYIGIKPKKPSNSNLMFLATLSMSHNQPGVKSLAVQRDPVTTVPSIEVCISTIALALGRKRHNKNIKRAFALAGSRSFLIQTRVFSPKKS